MPLKLYKRNHSPECLAVLQPQLTSGKLKPEDLATHKGCSCVWWVSGTNDFGVTIPRQSTKARTWGAACQALQKFNVPNKGAFDHRVTLVSGFEVWMEQEVNQLA